MSLGIYALVGVIMLVMAGVSFVYLVRVPRKSKPSRSLQWFFLCIMLSATAIIFTNLGTIWDWAFAPSQDALLILAGVFLLQYAYSYPSEDQPNESRWVIAVYSVISLLSVGYAVYFAIMFLSNLPAQLEEVKSFYLLTPICMAFAVIIFFRRSLHWSFKADPFSETTSRQSTATIKTLLKPNNVQASALLNFGFALSLGLIPALLIPAKAFIPPPLQSFLFNFGVVMAIGAMMLVYLNFAPEPTRISAKLVGISLVTVLLILGLASVWITLDNPGPQVHRFVLTFIGLVLGSSILIIAVFPIFFRSALLEPLARLLDAVKQANDGNLDVQVNVKFEDEVGFLSNSFNGMINALKKQTTRLSDVAMDKEREVAERTIELVNINQRLESENEERKLAEAQLEKMLRYEQALASCSQVFLLTAENEKDQLRILTEGLEKLRLGTRTDRVYLFRNFSDPEMGECLGILAETCGPGITPVIDHQFNQKVPWSLMPKAIPAALEGEKHIGGLTEDIFTDNPLKDGMLSQTPPLLSLLLFPIHFENRWWGFVGFDDCTSRREWGESEILLLRTASQILGRFIQRWQLQNLLVDTLGMLEKKVVERTQSYMETNLRLSEEVEKRRQFQQDLEQRLITERILARTSLLLLETAELKSAIGPVLENLGAIMQKGTVCLALVEPGYALENAGLYFWHDGKTQPFSPEIIKKMLSPGNWFMTGLREYQILQIAEVSGLPDKAKTERTLLSERGINSLVLVPLSSEGIIRGIIILGNSLSDGDDAQYNMQALEVMGGLLSNQLQREDLLRTLEVRVAEQTRELSTFYEMTMLSAQTQNLSDILYPALSRIQEISNSEVASIHIFSVDHQVLQLVAQRGIPQAKVKLLESVQAREDVLKWLNRAESDHGVGQQFPTDMPRAFQLPGFGSFLTSKLRAAGNTLGIISCYRFSNQSYTPFQCSILEIIGELLGVVIENQRLTQEAGKLATIQERQRLARELHDAVSQSIYSLSLFARSARDALDAGEKEKLQENLEQLETNSLSALKEMRLLLYQLRTITFEEGDLMHAIEARFDLVERRSGILAEIHADERVHFQPQIEQECFRVITEALNNAIYYAQASHVSVDLRLENDQIAVTVEDDGVGFTFSDIRAGMGIQNMRERAKSMNGSIDITSTPGRGTRVRLCVPAAEIQAGEIGDG